MHVRIALRRARLVWTTNPWMHWAVAFAIPMIFFLVNKLVALSAILDMFASEKERTFGNKLGGVLLGILQDLVITSLLVGVLVLLELVTMVCLRVTRGLTLWKTRILTIIGLFVKFVLVIGLAVATLAFFAADLLLVRTREMRFTTEFIVTYEREKAQASALKVDPREMKLATATIIGVAVVSLVYAFVFVCWVDLLGIRAAAPRLTESMTLTNKTPVADELSPSFYKLEEGTEVSESALRSGDDESGVHTLRETSSSLTTKKSWLKNRKIRLTLMSTIGFFVLLALTHWISTSATPVVATIGLNTTLNELFRNLFHVEFQKGTGSGSIASAAFYLHPETESFELFQRDVLYRRTTGFEGPLAFDVKVEEANPPNVLVIGVESFRYLDSLYLAGNTTAGDVLKKHNLTLTPQFDRWAKRGVAFNNMWSSWQTSRSLESILFGQVVLDSVTDTGTTRGRKSTKLEGMPQLFKQKGYETVFTTGCITTYDQWDKFLPSHGFDTVMAAPEFIKLAESEYNITQGDWSGEPQRGFSWGVHDDLSFDILGDLMINKTKLQADRVSRREPKKPFFLNHYTISSHGPFEAHPTWFDKEPLPDFTPLCEAWKDSCDLIKKYAKMRYFTDMMLGRFLDRMAVSGVLNDTIVVIVGDHGQSPEMKNPVIYQSAVTHVASTLIAEGRLGKHAGTVINDATHQYDLLNTLADITGVPDGGFLQTGVGRSLKRSVPFGSRPVWSNNPLKKMSVVRGHERFVYDRSVNAMGLFDTITDPLEHDDLLPSASEDKIRSVREDRRAGRELSAYFKHRWDNKCLTSVKC